MHLAELMVTRRNELVYAAAERLPEPQRQRVLKRIAKSRAGGVGLTRANLARIDNESIEIRVDDEVIFHGDPFRLLEESGPQG